jgi:hypothetical protein
MTEISFPFKKDKKCAREVPIEINKRKRCSARMRGKRLRLYEIFSVETSTFPVDSRSVNEVKGLEKNEKYVFSELKKLMHLKCDNNILNNKLHFFLFECLRVLFSLRESVPVRL